MPTPQGYSIQAGSLNWFYREIEPNRAEEAYPVVLLHDLPSQSHSWIPVMEALAEQGFRGIAPDWLGFGLSDMPDSRTFDYKPASYVRELKIFLDALEIQHCHLVVQGYLGFYGLRLAFEYPDLIERIAILNAPLTAQAQLPWQIQQMRIPFVGDMVTQDPLVVDRTLEGGTIYEVPDFDLDVYRRPFLKTSAAGRSLMLAVRQYRLKSLMQQFEQDWPQWSWPTVVVWGMVDPWLPVTMAETFTDQVKRTSLIRLEQVGHYPQQDWHEKVSDAVIPFFRKLVV